MIKLEKYKILTPLQKLPKYVGWFGPKNCCQRLQKVAQSAINRPIWSHCLELILSIYLHVYFSISHLSFPLLFFISLLFLSILFLSVFLLPWLFWLKSVHYLSDIFVHYPTTSLYFFARACCLLLAVTMFHFLSTFSYCKASLFISINFSVWLYFFWASLSRLDSFFPFLSYVKYVCLLHL